MGQLKLTVPDDIERWAETRVGSNGVGSVDAYFVRLAAEDREEERKRTWLQNAIEEGRNSGIDPRSVEQIFADISTKHNLPSA